MQISVISPSGGWVSEAKMTGIPVSSVWLRASEQPLGRLAGTHPRGMDAIRVPSTLASPPSVTERQPSSEGNHPPREHLPAPFDRPYVFLSSSRPYNLRNRCATPVTRRVRLLIQELPSRRAASPKGRKTKQPASVRSSCSIPCPTRNKMLHRPRSVSSP